MFPGFFFKAAYHNCDTKEHLEMYFSVCLSRVLVKLTFQCFFSN